MKLVSVVSAALLLIPGIAMTQQSPPQGPLGAGRPNGPNPGAAQSSRPSRPAPGQQRPPGARPPGANPNPGPGGAQRPPVSRPPGLGPGTGNRPPVARPPGGQPPATARPPGAGQPPARPPVARPPAVAHPPGARPPHYGGHRPPDFRPITAPPFRYPHGYRYRRWAIGLHLPRLFLSRHYYFENYAAYGLTPPPIGYRWVRYGPDLLLVSAHTGRIADIIYGAFF